jgi:hypothetical protein
MVTLQMWKILIHSMQLDSLVPSPSYVAINVDGSGVDLVTKGVSAHYAGIELHMTLIYLPVRLVLLLFGRLCTFKVMLACAVRTPSDP